MTTVRPLEIYTHFNPLQPTMPDAQDLLTAAHEIEYGGVDKVLVGYGSGNPDGWITAAYTLQGTSTLGIILAHRPGVMQPVAAARLASTLDSLSRGRLSMHIVTGGAPGDQYREGDYLDHDSRYQRSMEYVDIMKRVWQGTEPFDVETNYYKFDKVRQLIKPYNQAIPIYMGGASDAALEFGARHADCYMLWGEPLASVSDRLNAIRQAARAVGHQPPQFSLSLRLYVGSSSSEAWERATADLPHVSQTTAAKQRRGPHAEDTGRTRQLQFAQEREVHDTCLWMGIALATGGQGNTAALVGTEDQILQALQAYADLGIHAFLISGASGYWDPLLADTAKRMRHELQVRALT